MRRKPLRAEQVENLKTLITRYSFDTRLENWAEKLKKAYEEYLKEPEPRVFAAEALLDKFMGMYDEL